MITHDRTIEGYVQVDWQDLILPKVQFYDEEGYLIIQKEEEDGNKTK